MEGSDTTLTISTNKKEVTHRESRKIITTNCCNKKKSEKNVFMNTSVYKVHYFIPIKCIFFKTDLLVAFLQCFSVCAWYFANFIAVQMYVNITAFIENKKTFIFLFNFFFKKTSRKTTFLESDYWRKPIYPSRSKYNLAFLERA